jgi:hypothetical protein
MYPLDNDKGFESFRSEFVHSLSKKLKSEKFLESFNPGYDSFFMMPGGSEMNIEDDELSVTGTVTASKLKNAFMKMNKITLLFF